MQLKAKQTDIKPYRTRTDNDLFYPPTAVLLAETLDVIRNLLVIYKFSDFTADYQ